MWLIDVLAGSLDERAVLAAIAAAATGTSIQQQQQPAAAAAPPADELGGTQDNELLHQGQMVGELKPNIATTNPALLGTNVLHDMDRAVQVGH